MNKALLLIDLQKDFCKNGALEVWEGDETIETANEAIKIFSENKDLIIGTKDWHPKTHKSFAVNSNAKVGESGILSGLEQIWWPVHCVENTEGSEFHDNLHDEKINKIIYKGTDEEVDSYSSFFDNGKKKKTELDDYLKENKIKELYIMGLATDYCVKYTALDAVDLGYKVYLVKNGCRGVNLEPGDSERALVELRNKGVNIIENLK